MKSCAFDYHAPSTLAQALDDLATYGDGCRPLAGGQSLVPLLAARSVTYGHLVDLNGIDELAGIAVESDMLRIGAMTRQVALECSVPVARETPLLSRATKLVGNPQIRNRGTLGGSLVHADPAAEYPAVALVLDAEFELAGLRGIRTVSADDFYKSPTVSCLGPSDLLVEIRIPLRNQRIGYHIDEVGRRHGDYAIVGAAGAVEIGDDCRISDARLVLFGVAGRPVRATAAESAIVGQVAQDLNDADYREIGNLGVADVEARDDLHATAVYRRQVAARLVARVIDRSLGELPYG